MSGLPQTQTRSKQVLGLRRGHRPYQPTGLSCYSGSEPAGRPKTQTQRAPEHALGQALLS
eukprot:15433285-Alexandrium_andersonii.AAC.1